MTDIAVGATVSLIDTTTNNTVSTTVTDASGRFILNFTVGFRPQSGKAYYLEAFKGLPIDGEPNRAGASVARVRTLIAWDKGGWVSLTNAMPNAGISISRATTTISVITSLRSVESNPPNPLQLIGSINDTTFTPAGGISAEEFGTVFDFVEKALAEEADPLYFVAYDPANHLFLAQPVGVAIDPPSPLKGPIGTTVSVSGSNLSATPEVRFNGTLGTDMVVNSTQLALTVKVPPGATSGPMTLKVGSLVFGIGNFAVANWDGRKPFDSQDNLYVASYGSNQVFRVTPAGVTSVFAEDPGFTNPRGIVVDAQDNVYVSSYNGHKIFKVDPQGGISEYATGGGLDYPWHLTIDGAGKIYVANYDSDNILVIPPGGGTPQEYATGINGPTGLAFAPNGELWVTGRIDGSVYKIPAGGGAATVVAAGFNLPTGVCFDSAGNAYVTNRDKHQIVRISPQGHVSIFATFNYYPESIAMRSNGTLMVSGPRQYIIEYDLNGRTVGYRSASHMNYGIAFDSERNLYVTSGRGWGAQSKSVHKATYDPVTGKHGLLKPLSTDFLNPTSVALDPAGNVYVGDWTDGIYRLDKGAASPYQYARGVGSIDDMAFDGQGRMYAASYSNHAVYRFNNGAIDKRYGFAWNFLDMVRDPVDGTIYVTDYWQDKILKIDPVSGDLTNFTEDGSVKDAYSLIMGPDGNLYAGEFYNDRIVKIDKASRAVSVYATGINTPIGLAFDSTGQLFVSNWDDSRIHRVPAAPTTPYYAYNNRYVTGIDRPRGLAIDAQDNLYYAAWYAGTVFKIPAATGTPVAYGTGLKTPYRMIFDNPTGKLYVYDYGYRDLYAVPAGGGTGVPQFIENRDIGLAGMIRDADGVFYFSGQDHPRVFRLDPTTRKMDLFATGPVSPAGLEVVGQYVYGVDWDGQSIFRIDTVTDAIRVVKDTRVAMKGIARNPVDGKIYVQPWGSRPKVLDDLATGAWSDYSTGDHGLGAIAFDANGDMYSTTWDWAGSTSRGLVVRTRAADGVNEPAPIWLNYGSF
jgi:streptogramin lyase